MRDFLKRILPSHHEVRGHRHLRVLGDILHDPDIFHLTRRSAAGGVSAGLFVAFLPIPGHTIISAIAAIVLRVNLPLAVLLSWTSNPVTMPPMFFFAYKVGAQILGRTPRNVHFEFSLDWLGTTFLQIWPSLVTGCLVMATLSALGGYLVITLLWRVMVMRRWQTRGARKGEDN